jgi:hypothetical protein
MSLAEVTTIDLVIRTPGEKARAALLIYDTCRVATNDETQRKKAAKALG